MTDKQCIGSNVIRDSREKGTRRGREEGENVRVAEKGRPEVENLMLAEEEGGRRKEEEGDLLECCSGAH